MRPIAPSTAEHPVVATAASARDILAAVTFAVGCLGSVAILGIEGTDGIVGAFTAVATGLLASQLVTWGPDRRRVRGRGSW